MDIHNVQATSVITSLLSACLYCSLFIYVLYVGVYMHIRKIIRLLKKGSEAIGAELSGPSFIYHEHYFGTRTFSSEQISNV